MFMKSMMQQTYEYYFRHIKHVKEGKVVETNESKEDEKVFYQECLTFITMEMSAYQQENK